MVMQFVALFLLLIYLLIYLLVHILAGLPVPTCLLLCHQDFKDFLTLLTLLLQTFRFAKNKVNRNCRVKKMKC